MDDEPYEISAHIIAEDPRYPLLCINGKFTYGLSIDPETGDIGQERLCICMAHCDCECICDLEPKNRPKKPFVERVKALF